MLTLTNSHYRNGARIFFTHHTVSATVIGDANQDDNGNNDCLPGASRNSLVGPHYSTTDMRVSRKVYTKNSWRLEFTVESFNLFNRLNACYRITDDGL